MTANTQSKLTAESLALLDSSAAEYATEFIETLLEMCVQVGASDAHIQPSECELDVRWRLDGVLQPLGRFAAGEMSSPIARLKVLAGLLTYKTDLPQEGGVRKSQQGVEMRVSTFPTIQGERPLCVSSLRSSSAYISRILRLPVIRYSGANDCCPRPQGCSFLRVRLEVARRPADMPVCDTSWEPAKEGAARLLWRILSRFPYVGWFNLKSIRRLVLRLPRVLGRCYAKTRK